MKAVPRLSIGLPVYNGEQYLAESLDALLGQSYEDFELIISDNASTDGTEEICRRYVAKDSRVRYIRQPQNIGAAPNHNHVFGQCAGELFKWASHDDLYGRDLLLRCVEALDARPDVVLAHACQAIIDGDGARDEAFDYRLATDSPHAPERFRSLLFDRGGDDFYGVMRADVLRRIAPHDSYHHADRTIVAELALHGPFHQVPELLYFRRDHPTRAERANPTTRTRCANLDPRRASRLRHPTIRLLAEYVCGFVADRPALAASRQRTNASATATSHAGSSPGPIRTAVVRSRMARPCSRHPHRNCRLRCRQVGNGDLGELERAQSRSGRPLRVGLFGLLGAGNIGNDGSLEAVLAYLQAEHPEAVLGCMCTGPDTVVARYGLPVTAMHWYPSYERRAADALSHPLKALGKVVDAFRTCRGCAATTS